MSIRYYGLKVGDEVEYQGWKGKVVELSVMDNNRVYLLTEDGTKVDAVAEWCKKIKKGKTINGETIQDLLDDYAGRHHVMQCCKKYQRDEHCDICEADKKEMEKIVAMINMAI